MPLYEYECEACGHRFEVIQKFSDAPIDKCPTCGGTVHKMPVGSRRSISRAPAGYATDYAKSGSTTDSKGGKDGKKPEDASGSTDSSSGSDKPSSERLEPRRRASSSSGAAPPSASSTGSPKPETPKT